MTEPYYSDVNNLIRLARYMADEGYTADEVAYAIEKPWKHEDVWREVLNEDEFRRIIRYYNEEQTP